MFGGIEQQNHSWGDKRGNMDVVHTTQDTPQAALEDETSLPSKR